MADLDARLAAVLGEIQKRGGIGSQPIRDAIEHSDRFVGACPADAAVGVDLGSGGGLPALVIAVRRPELELHLVERRATRADLLRYGVTALGLDAQVHVHGTDVRTFAALGVVIDVVTARSFAALAATVSAAAELVRPGGVILVSASPAERPLCPALLDDLSVVDDGVQHGIHRYRRVLLE